MYLTDSTGAQIVIDTFTVKGTKVYGACHLGVYQLNNHDEWEQISPEIPDGVRDLVTDRKTVPKKNHLFLILLLVMIGFTLQPIVVGYFTFHEKKIQIILQDFEFCM